MNERSKELEEQVLRTLSASSRGPLKPKELARELGIPTDRYRHFKRSLTGMERAGKIYRVKGSRYGVPGKMDLRVGTLSLTRNGDGFVRPEGSGGDVFVPSVNLASALDGDRVVVRIEGRPPGRSPVGRVIKVLERARHTVVGTFHRSRRFSYVVPLDRRMSRHVLVPSGEESTADEGDVVAVRIDAFGDGNGNPIGAVEHVLGSLADPGVDVLAVAHSYGLALEFPPEVLAAAQRSAGEAGRDPGADRVDRTDLVVFTIDPADAKDHDDALSVRELPNGHLEVGVHIADVSHYVVEGGPVDLEARSRGTSVYLVDRVIPMLPEILSGDVCSLRPDVDRQAVSLFLELDPRGHVHAERFERTTVRSRRRLSYEEAQQVLDGTGSLGADLDEALRRLDDLARQVRAQRVARGALDLGLPESRVILDQDGVPVDIQKVERLETHRLIEDFMILANEAVARATEARGLPVLYRVHEPPVREKAEELEQFLHGLGHRLPRRKVLTPLDVQKLLDAVRGRPEEELVSTVVLRSLQRARYDPANLGHFGLASKAYLHFTSPIRRYPDLVVHREVVRSLIVGEPARERDPDEMRAIADATSAREEAAEEAERDSVALKKVEFMERHLGDELDGRISGVTAFGFFVTLDAYYVDGLVHVNSLGDDFYRLQEGSYTLVGDRGRRRFRLGDRVRVQVARVDKEARHVDFLLVRKLDRTKV
ncbi:MAG: ribonuclease R [Gemmatimonadetes bacterium]|nr:ribonuclease R [Gemmatimonadota bacterium]